MLKFLRVVLSFVIWASLWVAAVAVIWIGGQLILQDLLNVPRNSPWGLVPMGIAIIVGVEILRLKRKFIRRP